MIIMIGISGKSKKNLDHKRTRILFSQCKFCSVDKTMFLGFKLNKTISKQI